MAGPELHRRDARGEVAGERGRGRARAGDPDRPGRADASRRGALSARRCSTSCASVRSSAGRSTPTRTRRARATSSSSRMACGRSASAAMPSVIGKRIQLDGVDQAKSSASCRAASRIPTGRQAWLPLDYDENFVTKQRGAWYLARRRAPEAWRDPGAVGRGDGDDRAQPRPPVSGRERQPGHDDVSAARGDGGRHPARGPRAARRGRLRPADRLRQRRQPAARARGGQGIGDGGADGARRRARPARAAAADRVRDAVARGRRPRAAAGGLGRRVSRLAQAAGHSAPGRHRCRRDGHRVHIRVSPC